MSLIPVSLWSYLSPMYSSPTRFYSHSRLIQDPFESHSSSTRVSFNSHPSLIPVSFEFQYSRIHIPIQSQLCLIPVLSQSLFSLTLFSFDFYSRMFKLDNPNFCPKPTVGQLQKNPSKLNQKLRPNLQGQLVLLQV